MLYCLNEFCSSTPAQLRCHKGLFKQKTKHLRKRGLYSAVKIKINRWFWFLLQCVSLSSWLRSWLLYQRSVRVLSSRSLETSVRSKAACSTKCDTNLLDGCFLIFLPLCCSLFTEKRRTLRRKWTRNGRRRSMKPNLKTRMWQRSKYLWSENCFCGVGCHMTTRCH